MFQKTPQRWTHLRNSLPPYNTTYVYLMNVANHLWGYYQWEGQQKWRIICMFGGMVLVSCNPVICVWDIQRSTSILTSLGLPPRYLYVLRYLHFVHTLLIWGKTNGPGSSSCSVFDLQQWMPWRRNWKVNKKNSACTCPIIQCLKGCGMK